MARATAKTRAPKKRRRSARRVKRAPVKRTPDVRQRARDAFDGLEQRHYDLIGLIMVAIGVYSAFVLYLGWDGGAVGKLALVGARVHGRAGRLRRAADGLRPRPRADRPADDPGAARAQRRRASGDACAPARVRGGNARPRARQAGAPRLLRARVLPQRTAARSASRSTGPRPSLFQRLGAQILAVLMLLSGFLLLTGHDDREPRPERRRGDAPRLGRDRRRRPRRPRTTDFPSTLPGWDEPDDVDIQITRANETEVLANEPMWDEPEVARTSQPRRPSPRAARARSPTTRRTATRSRARSRAGRGPRRAGPRQSPRSRSS